MGMRSFADVLKRADDQTSVDLIHLTSPYLSPDVSTLEFNLKISTCFTTAMVFPDRSWWPTACRNWWRQ
jgi:hypothetical protein